MSRILYREKGKPKWKELEGDLNLGSLAEPNEEIEGVAFIGD